MNTRPKLIDNDIWVFAELINVKNPKDPRTAQQVTQITGLSKQYVSKIIKKLLKSRYIKPLTGSKTDILYSATETGSEIKGMINSKVIDALRMKNLVDRDHGRLPTSSISAAEGNPPSFHFDVPMVMAAHFPYTPCRFEVMMEGEIEYTKEMRIRENKDGSYDIVKTGEDRKNTKPVKFPIFGRNARTRLELENQENYETTFSVEGGSFLLRYQKTNPNKGRAKRLIYIDPVDDPVFLLSEIKTDDDVGQRIVNKCYLVLDWLQKFAGWRFSYTPLNDIRRYHIYSANRELNQYVLSKAGRKIMESEGYKVWFDGSHRVSDGHLESKELAFFKALEALADIRSDIEEAKIAVNDHEVRITDVSNSVIHLEGTIKETTAATESNARTIEEVKRSHEREIYGIWLALEDLAQSQHATLKIIKASAGTAYANTNDDGVMFG